MDELKLRLEYLEYVSQAKAEEDSLLSQVDAIGSTLDTMLGVRKQEVQRMTNEFDKHDGIGEPIPSEAAKSSDNEAQFPSEDLKKTVVATRLNDLSRLASELETQLPLEIPEIKPPPNPEELIARASALGREFDELTARSTELTKRMMDQLAQENHELSKADDSTVDSTKTT